MRVCTYFSSSLSLGRRAPEARALVPLRLATRGPDTARFRVFREHTAAHEPRSNISRFGTQDGESNK